MSSSGSSFLDDDSDDVLEVVVQVSHLHELVSHVHVLEVTVQVSHLHEVQTLWQMVDLNTALLVWI